MKVLNPQQALVVLSVVTLSLGLQIAMLSLPLVILGGLLFLLVWRHWLALWQVPKALTMLAILSVLVLLWVQYGGFLSLEPMVGLLAFSVLLKLIEASSGRDVYLLILLSLFGLATPLLFSQSLMLFVLVMVLGFAHLGVLTFLHGGKAPKVILKTAWNVVLLSIPLALVLFFIVPRLPPLWAVPMAKPQASTGLSDQMAMGDIASLSRDTRLAFQATFRGDIPVQGERYWRSMMLVNYDGETWRPLNVRENVDKRQVAAETNDFFYTVLMQASDSPWLPLLGRATQWPNNVFVLRDGTIQSKKNIFTKQLFPVASQSSFLDNSSHSDTALTYLNQNRFLPKNVHPKTRALARELGQGLQGREQLQNLLRYFNQQKFYYTLSPGQLVGDKVDSFVFNSRQGFCEHYAAAFAIMARELGYPARIATGYLGGEVSTFADNTLSIYQYDAHAWVEIWLPSEGWQRFDPTAWVNPARVDQSSLSLDAWRESELSGVEQWMWIVRSQAMMMQARHYAEWINLRWVQFMLNYDSSGQLSFLQRWLGEISVWKMLVLLFAALLVWLIYDGLTNIYRTKKQDPLIRVYQQILITMQLPLSISPAQLVKELERQAVAAEAVKKLEAYWYGGQAINSKDVLAGLKKILGQIKKSPAV